MLKSTLILMLGLAFSGPVAAQSLKCHLSSRDHQSDRISTTMMHADDPTYFEANVSHFTVKVGTRDGVFMFAKIRDSRSGAEAAGIYYDHKSSISSVGLLQPDESTYLNCEIK